MIEEKALSAAVDNLFANISFPEEPKGLYDPLRYMIAIGGKRIRPRLCLLCHSIFSGDVRGDAALECAAALEVFHTFTLIHDDIMDRSPMRRGHETVWKKWNEDTAVLSGDVMCIDSYRRIAAAPAPVLGEAMNLFSDMAAKVCEGQQLDMDFETFRTVTMGEYMRMIGLKTGELIAASAKLGAVMASAPAEASQMLYEYGFRLGLAFQVADDYLDTYGDASVFGKPIGGDIINCKKTWLLIRALEKTDDPAALLAEVEKPVSDAASREEKIGRVRSIFDSLGVGEDARAEVRRLSEEAMEAVSGIDSIAGRSGTEVYDRLHAFAESLVGRAK